MQLAHHRDGAGSPLVLVHGTGSQWQAFRPVLEPLLARHEVIAPDLPGFGDSPALAAGTPHTPRAFAERVAALLDQLDIERAHVAGFSLGGGIAYELGLLGRARSVTAISPIGFWTAREAAYCRASLRITRAAARALLPAMPALLAGAAGRTLLASQLVARPWRMSTEHALQAARCLALCPGFDAQVRDSLAASYRWTQPLEVPVTIAWGTRDRLLLPRQAVRARARRAEARHVTLPGCGHVPFTDDPPLLARVLLQGSGD